MTVWLPSGLPECLCCTIVGLDGNKEVLGLWTSANEGAKFWLNGLTELRNRGVKDIYLVCVDGLKGFPQAIESIFPKAQVQLCIVHMVRASMNYVSWRDLKHVVKELKPVYKAPTADEAERQLTEFETKWPKYPAIARLWRENWNRVIPFFSFPEEVRRVVYTTKRGGVTAQDTAENHQDTRVVPD